jgi:hypothetical protein
MEINLREYHSEVRSCYPTTSVMMSSVAMSFQGSQLVCSHGCVMCFKVILCTE